MVSSGKLNIARAAIVTLEAGYYRIEDIHVHNIDDSLFRRSFSMAPNMTLYALVSLGEGGIGRKEESDNSCGCSCSCKAGAGSTSASVGCARWDMNIGNFEDIAGVLNAQLRMRAFDLSADERTPAALFLHHPMLSVLSVADGITTITRSSGDGVSYDISTGLPTSGSGKHSSRTRLLDEQYASLTAESPVSSAAYLEECFADSSALTYPIAGGQAERMLTSEQVLVTASEWAARLELIFDVQDRLRQILDSTLGLPDLTTSSATSYGIALFPTSQVGAKGLDGLYTTTGNPIKTSTFNGVVDTSLSIAEQEGQNPVTHWNWTKDGNNWNWHRGAENVGAIRLMSCKDSGRISGEKATPGKMTRTTSLPLLPPPTARLPMGKLWCGRRKVTVKMPATRTTTMEKPSRSPATASLFASMNPPATTLAMSTMRRDALSWPSAPRPSPDTSRRAPAPPTPPAASTTTAPPPKRTYSSQLPAMRSSWRPRPTSYEDSASLHRVTISRSGAGVTGTRTTITENYGDSVGSLPAYARGQLKYEQNEIGVETHHSYETSSAYGSVVKHTSETRISNTPVVGKSTRSVEYLAADGNVLHAETYAYTAADEWTAMTASTYSYDVRGRELSRTHSNGRISTRFQRWSMRRRYRLGD